MNKSILITALMALAGCSHADREQTRDDAKKLGQDIKRGTKKADEVVTKELREAREKVQKGIEKAKQ